MADITMCKDEQCEKKETCYRHEAEPSMLQPWFGEIVREGQECAYYWPLKRVI